MNTIENEKEELRKYGFTKKVLLSLYELVDAENYRQHVKARKELVEQGEKILPVMYRLLKSEYHDIRREAIKVVQLIAHKSSIPVIIEMLEDSESDVRWIAAEALIRIGRKSIEPLLEALVADGKSAYLRQGAHHVLSKLANKKDSDKMRQLIHILGSGKEVPERIPVYAANTLKQHPT